MFRKPAKLFTCFFVGFSSLVTSGCTEHWWSRGQPPAPESLLERSRLRLQEMEQAFGDARPEIAGAATAIDGTFRRLVSSDDESSVAPDAHDASADLESLIDQFIALEGKLAVTSRAAFSELSSQLRFFSERAHTGEAIDTEALRLLAARVNFFFARELAVPGPAPASGSSLG